MRRYSTVIIGAGQSGLAMSKCLSERSIDHLILERGEIANSWRTERWDSLRLLTPNWQSRLPGSPYTGPDPDGYMSMPEVIQRLQAYADDTAAPIQTSTTVLSVNPTDAGYLIDTNQGPVHCATLVLANGACNLPNIPCFAEEVPRGLYATTSQDYKRPSDLPDGGILVVGGSATGVQLAMELQTSGRQVTLSVGEHIRAPRVYRGRDIKWWMDAIGTLDQGIDEVGDPKRVRRSPSLQLVGSHEKQMLDLNALTDAGVDVVGKLVGIRDGNALFSGALANHCALSDLKMNRLLDAIDMWASNQGLDGVLPSPHRFDRTRVSKNPRLQLDLSGGAIRSVLWATGYRPDYSWLRVPVFDRKGRLRHSGGIVDAPGLYAMGLPFMRKRKSTLIDGVGDDAQALSEHIVAQMNRKAA